MYSPNEVNKANDKSCNRRRGDAQFNPVWALDHVKRLNKGVHCRNREYISAVKKQFKEVSCDPSIEMNPTQCNPEKIKSEYSGTWQDS